MSSPMAGKRLTYDDVILLLAVMERTPQEVLLKMQIWDGPEGIAMQLGLKDVSTSQAKYRGIVENLKKAEKYRPRATRLDSNKETEAQSLTETSKAKKAKKRQLTPDFAENAGQNPLMDGISGLLESNVEVDEMEETDRRKPTK